MISKLIEFNTKLIAKGQHKKISDLEARAVLLQRKLHDFDFLYSKGDTAEPEHTSKETKQVMPKITIGGVRVTHTHPYHSNLIFSIFFFYVFNFRLKRLIFIVKR